MAKKQLVEFELDDDKTILVEVAEVEGSGIKPVSRKTGELAVKAKQTFEQAIANIEPMMSSIRKKIDDMNQPADEVEVKFGVKLNGETSAVIATLGAEVNYEITLKWSNKEKSE